MIFARFNIAKATQPLGMAAVLAASVAVAQAQGPMSESGSKAMATLATWSMDAQKGAKGMIEKHGTPNEVTPTMMVWYNAGPFKRIVATSTTNMHDFPAPHKDSVEEYINFRVPARKFSDLARFDGSVNVDRTRGEMSARCDSEAHNLLALNLASEIVAGRRSVESARAFYSRVIKVELTTMKLHPYEEHLNFVPVANASDADHVSALLVPVVAKMKMMGKM